MAIILGVNINFCLFKEIGVQRVLKQGGTLLHPASDPMGFRGCI